MGKKANNQTVSNFRQLAARYEDFNDNIAFKYKQKGKIIDVTYKKFAEDIKALGTAIINLGIDKIAIIGNNRYEWCTSYMAVTTAGKIIIPLDKALTEKEIIKLVKTSGAQAVIYDEKYQKAIDKCDLEYKICMDELIENGVTRYKHLLKQGYDLLKQQYDAYSHITIDKDKVAVMMFTSSTTEEPKEVILSQSNLCSQVNALPKDVKLYQTDKLLSFLPIHDCFEFTITFLYGTYCGVTIVFCDGQKYIAQNLKDYKITVFVADPLVLDSIYKKFLKEIEDSGKKDLLDKRKNISNILLKFHIDIRKKLFNPIINQLGEDLRIILYEATSMDKEIIRGYSELGIKLVQIVRNQEKKEFIEIEEIE